MSTTSRKSAVKPGLVIAIGLIVMAMAFAAFAFKGSLITYMGFQQAMNAGGDTTVQIIGAPVKDATRYDQAANTLDFTLRETATGATMPVVFKSPKPDNFDEAVQITAQGRYNPQSQVFEANNLLVKCPSKYAGQKQPGAKSQRTYGARS